MGCFPRDFKEGKRSQVPKRVVSKRVVLAGVPLYRHFIFLPFCFFYVLAVRRCLSPQAGGDPDQVFSLRFAVHWRSAVVGCGHSLECRGRGGVRRECIMHLELSRAGTTVPHLYPQEVRRYHGRYGGTTPAPSGGTTAPPLYSQEVRWYHLCTWRWYACEIPVFFFFLLNSHLGKWPLYLVHAMGATVVPRAGTRVVPSDLLEVHYPFCSTQYICFALLSNDLGRQAAVQLQVQSWRHSE